MIFERSPIGWSILVQACMPGGDPNIDDCRWTRRRWNGSQAYADTKFRDVLLAFGVARRSPHVLSNAVTAGWVATRMDGSGASDDLAQGHLTQAWLAGSDDPKARLTGGYFYHQKGREGAAASQDPALQDGLLDCCRGDSGLALA